MPDLNTETVEKKQFDEMVAERDAAVTARNDSNTKLAEFRDNNRTLHADLKKFDGVDPEEYRRLKAAPPPGSKQPSEVERVVNEAVSKVASEAKARVDALEAKLGESERRLSDSKVRAAITSAAVAAGAADSALEDIVRRGEQIFAFGDGRVKSGHFEKANPTKELTPDAWLSETLSKTAPHLFKPSIGGGATPQQQVGITPEKKLHNPSAEEIGRNLADIASGKVEVII